MNRNEMAVCRAICARYGYDGYAAYELVRLVDGGKPVEEVTQVMVDYLRAFGTTMQDALKHLTDGMKILIDAIAKLAPQV